MRALRVLAGACVGATLAAIFNNAQMGTQGAVNYSFIVLSFSVGLLVLLSWNKHPNGNHEPIMGTNTAPKVWA